jgi:Protein of unknown function (DUF1353)
MPFDPADRRLELRVIPPNRFQLLKRFSYTDPKKRLHVITPNGVGNTDLASVPWFLWWFVASYGRHTAAALVHDQLIETIDRRQADWVFRSALKESGTGLFRRWLMWAAVSFETSFRTTFMDLDRVDGYPERRKQRTGGWVTLVGFAFVFGHLASAVVLAGGWWKWTWPIGHPWHGHAPSQWLGVVLAIAWIAMWRRPGILLAIALAILGPAIVAVLATALGFWLVFELGLLRLVWWLVSLPFGGGRSPAPGGIGPTMRPLKAPVDVED